MTLTISQEKNGLSSKELKLEVTDAAKAFIAEAGSDEQYGARPLKRYIQAHVETILARTIIATDPQPDSAMMKNIRMTPWISVRSGGL